MVRRISRCLGTVSVLLVGVLVASCAPKSAEEKVAELRSYYSAEVNPSGFIVDEEPIFPEVPEVPAEETAEAEVKEAVAGGESIEPMAEIQIRQKVQLDILIKHRSDELLPGITVDVSMVGPDKVEKGHWRVWFDTSQVLKANVTPFTHILEDVGYEEGDMFSAEVRHPVPVEDRGEYREFSTTP